MPVTASVVRYPFPYEPVNTNGMWFGLSSTQSTLTDFKYIFSLYTYEVSSWNGSLSQSLISNLGSFKVPPDPVSGNGYYTPHRGLKSKMGNRLLYGPVQLSPTQSTPMQYNNSPIKYGMNWGLEWNPLTLINSIKTISPFTNIQLFFVGNQDIAADDVIKISKTNPQFDSAINTFATVISTTFSSPTFSCMLDISQSGGLKFQNDTGRIVYQKRMIGSFTQSNLGTGPGGTTGTNSDLYGIDGVRTLPQDYTQRVIGTYRNGFFLTSLKNRNIYLNEWDSISVIADPNQTADRIDQVKIDLINSSGSIYASYTYPTYWSNYVSAYPHARQWTFACGTNDIAQLTGNNLSLASSYTIGLGNTSSGTTQSFTRTIVDNCSPYENVRLAWLNKLGGWDFFSFNMMSKFTANVSRVEWKRNLPFNYNVTDSLSTRQKNYLTINTEESFQINSDWISEAEYAMLQDLVESPEVYIVNGLTYSGAGTIQLITIMNLPNPQVTPIMITTTQYNQKKIANDYIFNMTIEYKRAYDEINHLR